MEKSTQVPKFLIIQTAFIGDVVLATALVEKIHSYYPTSSIHFLVKMGNEEVLKNNPHIQKVWIWNKSESKIKNLFSLIGSLGKERYDYVINCHRFFSSGLISTFSGAKHRIGFDKNPLSMFYSHKVKHTFDGIHEIQRNQNLIAHLTDSKPAKPRIYPDEMSLLSFGNQPYITISPASVWHTKQLPSEKWIAFMNAVPPQYAIVVLGGAADKHLCEILKKSVQNTHRVCLLAGRLSLLQSASIMEQALMNYVNDSAPMHLASAVNAPTCVVYCSTVPSFGFGPLSDEAHIVEVTGLECRPCGIHGHNQCPQTHFKCGYDIEINKMLELIPNT